MGCALLLMIDFLLVSAFQCGRFFSRFLTFISKQINIGSHAEPCFIHACAFFYFFPFNQIHWKYILTGRVVEGSLSKNLCI